MSVVGCLLCVFFPIHSCQSNSESSLRNGHSLFLSSLSCLSLVTLSGQYVTHSYRSICLIVTENSSVFNLCCTEPMQHDHIHSIHSPFTHLLAFKTHSHSADHSLIPQAHAIIPLHDYKAYKTRSRETKLGALWFHANTRLKMSPPPHPPISPLWSVLLVVILLNRRPFSSWKYTANWKRCSWWWWVDA